VYSSKNQQVQYHAYSSSPVSAAEKPWLANATGGERVAPHMNGYKKGESTLPEDITINAPKANKIKASGINHHFFSWRKKRKNSFRTGHMSEALNNAWNVE
jgi:hypothetical protein